MARVSLIEEDGHPELVDLIARIRGARRGRLINIYKLLLHSPALAESWFAHNNAVRWKTELDGRLRELVIIRIGFISGVDYIVRQHVPALAIPEGLTWVRAAPRLFQPTRNRRAHGPDRHIQHARPRVAGLGDRSPNADLDGAPPASW
jgi:hypothetical protein